MGVSDAPVAERLEDYAPLALALGRDPQRRSKLRAALVEAAKRELFVDALAVREFEQFLEAAVAAAGRGEKLPIGWKPDGRTNPNALQRGLNSADSTATQSQRQKIEAAAQNSSKHSKTQREATSPIGLRTFSPFGVRAAIAAVQRGSGSQSAMATSISTG